MAKKLVAILFLILITLPTMFSCASCFGVPYAEVEVSGNEVENSVNNYLAGGRLVRIGDSLYYGYEKNALSHGVIKISSSGSERIYYGGDYTLQPGQPSTPNLMDYDSKLVAGMDKWREWRYYSFDSAKFEKYESLPETERLYYSVFQPIRGNIAFPYYSLGEFDDEKGVFNSESKIKLIDENGEEIDVISDNSITFYAVGDFVFYSEYNADDGSYSITKYNVNDKSKVEVVRVDSYSVDKIYVDGNYLILFEYAKNSVLLVDLESENSEIKIVISGSNIEADLTEYYDINVYAGKIYAAWKSNGLYVYNLDSGKLSKLCDTYAEECYIVDDYWVYFVGEESSLWRVAQDGSNVERIYG